MIVGQYNGGCVDADGRLHDLANRNSGRIGAALPQLLAAQQLALGIQAEEKHRFQLPPEKMGHQIVRALFQGWQNLHMIGPVYHIKSAHLGNQGQKHRRVFPDTRHLHQLLRAGLQHLGKAAEMVQQGMGNGVRIHPWDHIKQQQLQGLDVRKTVQSLLAKPPFHPFSVAFVHRTASLPRQKSCLLFANKGVTIV